MIFLLNYYIYIIDLLNSVKIGQFIQLIIPILLSIAIYTLGERKLMASMQRRLGPNVVGIYGLLQPFSDAIKLLFKEIVIPLKTNRFLFLMAPMLFLILSLSVWILLPLNDIYLFQIFLYNTQRPFLFYNDTFPILYTEFLNDYTLYSFHNFSLNFLSNLVSLNTVVFSIEPFFMKSFYKNVTHYMPYNMLLLFFISSLSIFGIIISGWSSNSKYPLLGAIRSGAQMISYEIAIGFVFLIIIMVTGSFNFFNIIAFQQDLKLIYPLFPLFFVFLVCALAETNRVPFDLPEAEAELVAGYNLEYSSITFAMFFLAEYSSMMVMAFLLLFFFFGGWISFFSTFLFYFGGLLFFLIFYVWIRATLPRYRYDQLMDIGWKVLIPFSLCFLFFLVCFLFYFDSFVLVLPEPFLNLIIF